MVYLTYLIVAMLLIGSVYYIYRHFKKSMTMEKGCCPGCCGGCSVSYKANKDDS